MHTAVFYSVFAVLLCFVPFGSAQVDEPFQCYVCSSELNGTDCGTGSDVPDKYKIACQDAPQVLGGELGGGRKDGSVTWNSCRKIITWVDFDVEELKGPVERVLRRCGFEEEKPGASPCVYKGGLGGRQRVCTCKTPNCNSAPMSLVSILSIFMPVFIIAIFQY
jgi:hypothetical protein